MTRFVMNLWSEQEGQNLPEFALLLFLVCLTAVSAMGIVAIKVDRMYANVSTHMAAAGHPALSGGSISFSTGTPAEIPTESKDATQHKSTD